MVEKVMENVEKTKTEKKYTYCSLVKRSKKPRKGKGKKKAASTNPLSVSNSENIVDVPPLVAEQIPGTSKVFAPLKNVSEEKLVNSSFVQLENTPTKLKKTRVTTAKLGLRAYKKKHVATGYKIMDITLLQENLVSFAACSMCKRSSCLKIVTDPGKKRYGLTEHYVLQCSNCHFEKNCYTSKRTINDGKQSYFDVNVRSVHAAHGLTTTCYV